VPGVLDSITCRAVLQEPRRGQPPLSTPAAVADALADVPRPVPAPMAASPPPSLNLRSEAPDSIDSSPSIPPIPLPPRPAPSGGTFSRALVIVVVVLIMAAVGLGAWTIGRSLGQPDTPQATSSRPPATAAPKAKAVKPANARGFDPSGDNQEHPDIAGAAIDGKPSSDWHTDSYNSAEFGNLKKGVGLLLDMGKPVQVSDVVVSLGDTKGASLQLKVGDSADLGALKTVADKSDATGSVTLTPGKAATGQYVLIWFTRLPTFEGKFRGTIYEVVVHSPGSA
jgi:hypothetical protein